jgi:hypothetical protein
MAALGLAGCHEHGASAKDDHAHSEPAKQESAAKHDDHHDHAHADPDKAAASLTLNNGAKWQTDDVFRTEMTAIRNLMQAAVKPIHAEPGYSADEYKALAANIDKEIGNIVAKCKLPREVDDQAHLVLVQILAGTDLMKKDGDRIKGAVKVIQGLQSYEKFFDHPDWKPLEH